MVESTESQTSNQTESQASTTPRLSHMTFELPDSIEETDVPEILKYARVLARFRPATYASDVGEATRGVMPKLFVTGMYGVTFAYVGSDLYLRNHTYDKIVKQHHTEVVPSKTTYLGHYALWHGQASIAFPALAMHTIVDITKRLLRHDAAKFIPHRVARWIPAVVAISAIPPLIHPLDKTVDFVMEHTYQKFTGFDPHAWTTDNERKHQH